MLFIVRFLDVLTGWRFLMHPVVPHAHVSCKPSTASAQIFVTFFIKKVFIQDQIEIKGLATNWTKVTYLI